MLTSLIGGWRTIKRQEVCWARSPVGLGKLRLRAHQTGIVEWTVEEV